MTPDELAAALRATGLRVKRPQGMVFDPLRREWKLWRDLGVNYFMAAGRGKSGRRGTHTLS